MLWICVSKTTYRLAVGGIDVVVKHLIVITSLFCSATMTLVWF
jgi:hypothetical protein